MPQSELFDKWLYLLRNLNRLDRIPDQLRESIFEKLFEVAEIARFSPEEVQAYEDSLKSYRDLKNALDTAKEEAKAEGKAEGIAEGIAEGRLEEKRLIVIKSHQAGLATEVIATITGLSPEEVEIIINES